jgi:hypothetical protein
MTNYVIVRNPKSLLLPRSLRVRLGEIYMGVDIDPFFTSDYAQARVFPSFKWADTYLHDQAGRVRPGMQGCVIRACRDAHTIPLGVDVSAKSERAPDAASKA